MAFCERRRIRTFDRLLRRQVLYPAELCVHLFLNLWQSFVGVAGFEPAASCSQSRRDNRATRHPEGKVLSGETGTRTLATVTRRQISNLLHYRSGTSPSSKNVSCFAVANVTHHPISHNYFDAFFYYFFYYF